MNNIHLIHSASSTYIGVSLSLALKSGLFSFISSSSKSESTVVPGWRYVISFRQGLSWKQVHAYTSSSKFPMWDVIVARAGILTSYGIEDLYDGVIAVEVPRSPEWLVHELWRVRWRRFCNECGFFSWLRLLHRKDSPADIAGSPMPWSIFRFG